MAIPTTFTHADAQDFMEQQRSTWQPISLGEFIARQHLSCVDGREIQAVIGTAGGSLGMFVEVLTAIETVTRSRLNTNEINRFFGWYVATLGVFYHHTDTHAIDHLTQALRGDPRYQPTKLITNESVVESLFEPDPNPWYQLILLDHLLSASNVGCGHLSRMLKAPDQYRVRAELVKDSLRAFFTTLWYDREIREKLVFQVLDHDHHEQAVIQVMVEGEITADTHFPLVVPNFKGTQVFIQHPQVEAAVRQHVAKVIAYHPSQPIIKWDKPEDFVKAMDQIGADLLRETLSRLALGRIIHQYTLPADWWKSN